MLRFIILAAAVYSVEGSCPDRKSTMACFYKVADKNGDGVITRHELSKSVFHALAWYEKIPFQVFGGIDKIIKDCDVNGDGKLTLKESLTSKTCMDSCFKRRHTRDKFNC